MSGRSIVTVAVAVVAAAGLGIVAITNDEPAPQHAGDAGLLAAQSADPLQFSPVVEEALESRITGSEFADMLGVAIVDGPPADCFDYAEIEESGRGYCLTGVVESGLETWVAGSLLQGSVPSDEQIQDWADAGSR